MNPANLTEVLMIDFLVEYDVWSVVYFPTIIFITCSWYLGPDRLQQMEGIHDFGFLKKKDEAIAIWSKI